MVAASEGRNDTEAMRAGAVESHAARKRRLTDVAEVFAAGIRDGGTRTRRDLGSRGAPFEVVVQGAVNLRKPRNEIRAAMS